MEIKISPDFLVVANRLSGLSTRLLTPILEGASAEAAPVLERALKQEAPKRSGDTAKSIRVVVATGARGRSARLEVFGNSTIRYIVKGTKPHVITPRSRRYLAWLRPDGTVQFARSVQHPGSPANDFVDRAWQTAQPEMSRIIRATGARAWRDNTRFTNL